MNEWLREGIEGRSLKATLRLYLLGLMLLGPVAALLALVLGLQISFVVTPLLVLILVSVEYAVSYRAGLDQYFKKLFRNFPLQVEDKHLLYALTSKDTLPNELDADSSLASLVRDSEGTECLGKDDVDSLIIALKHQDREVRYCAAKALHKIGDLKAVGPLLNALGDQDPFVHSSVVVALLRIKNNLPSTEAAVLELEIRNALVRVKRDNKDAVKTPGETVRKRA